MARKLRTNITQEEINKLFKLEGEDFFKSAYDFLIEKLGIPSGVKPEIVIHTQEIPVEMAYMPYNNAILRKPKFQTDSKSFIFGIIRHEIQHLKQNLDILRHEELGKKAVEAYSDETARRLVLTLEELVNKYSLEDFVKTGANPAQISEFFALKSLVMLNRMEEYHDALSEIGEVIKNNTKAELERVRQVATAELGAIKPGTREAARAEKYYDEFININYWKEDNSIDLGKYVFSYSEIEAMTSQSVAMSEFDGKKECYMSVIRKAMRDNAAMADKVRTGKLAETDKDAAKMYGEILKTSDDMLQHNSREEILDNLTKFWF